MPDNNDFLGRVEKVATTQNIDDVNKALSNGWKIIKVSEEVFMLDDGGKSTHLTYHLGYPTKLPI